MLSAAPAYASDPTFVLVQSEARAGDTIQFSIAGAKKHVTYEIEVGGKEVLEGGSSGGEILGQFTMPGLGAASRSVTVEAEIDERRGTTVVRRKLQYLIPAPPPLLVSAPLAPEPPATPALVVEEAAAPSPEPAHTTSPAAPVAPASVDRRATRAPRQAGGGSRGTRRHRGTDRPVVGKKRRAKQGEKRRSKRPAARTAPLFDGVPEPGSGPPSPAQADDPASSSLNAIAPPTSVLSATGTEGLSAAVVIPGLLGLAALALAGAALLRKRLTAPRV